MKQKDASKYEILYDLPQGEYQQKEVGAIRTRTIRAGDSIEVEAFPLTKVDAAARSEYRRRASSHAQQVLNRRNACKRIRRLGEANFTAEDVHLTLTWRYPVRDRANVNLDDLRREYAELDCPEDEAAVRRAFRNFIRALKRDILRMGGDPRELKYIYVIESAYEPLEDDPNALPAHYHLHVLLHAPKLSREMIEARWNHGYANAKKLDLRNNGLAALSAYLTKQRRSLRRWEHSRNLIEPEVRISDRKISRRRAAAIARDVQADGREILEALYPGYRYEECEVKYSDFVAGAYIYARLRRIRPTTSKKRGREACRRG